MRVGYRLLRSSFFSLRLFLALIFLTPVACLDAKALDACPPNLDSAYDAVVELSGPQQIEPGTSFELSLSVNQFPLLPGFGPAPLQSFFGNLSWDPLKLRLTGIDYHPGVSTDHYLVPPFFPQGVANDPSSACGVNMTDANGIPQNDGEAVFVHLTAIGDSFPMGSLLVLRFEALSSAIPGPTSVQIEPVFPARYPECEAVQPTNMFLNFNSGSCFPPPYRPSVLIPAVIQVGAPATPTPTPSATPSPTISVPPPAEITPAPTPTLIPDLDSSPPPPISTINPGPTLRTVSDYYSLSLDRPRRGFVLVRIEGINSILLDSLRVTYEPAPLLCVISAINVNSRGRKRVLSSGLLQSAPTQKLRVGNLVATKARKSKRFLYAELSCSDLAGRATSNSIAVRKIAKRIN